MRVAARTARASLLIATFFGIVAWAPTALRQPTTLRTLVIGGGPDLEHNQVAIESNVRYLAKLLPTNTPMRVLFTDGNPRSENVQCLGEDQKVYYRAPQLPRLDGPAKSAQVKSEMDKIAADLHSRPGSPVLLYFTGHGSPDRRSQFNNNRFDLWGGEDFSVKDLSRSLSAFPKGAPVTIVMVQCFSGAFGNVLFENGDPGGDLVDQNVCGFFAAVPTRMAAGCTPEIKEADYKDFSGYFFSALTGVDRMGKPVEGADYNRDGKVGMNEAFAYALLHDESIDTPVCTSDTFLRRYVKTLDPEIFQTPYGKVRGWASPAQLAALDGLSKLLSLSGEDRLTRAYESFTHTQMGSDDLRDVRLIRFVRLAKSIVLAHSLEAGGDQRVKARFGELLKAESANPLR